jgi:rSAM/selenodomain-associated transferase 1
MAPARRSALVIFAKLPVPGQVKTRLVPALTEAQAARLYAAFLGDALAQYAALEADLRLYLSPPVPAVPPGLARAVAAVRRQEGSDLGTRMQHACLETFAAGYRSLVLIGTDHPTLPTAFVAEAFAALAAPQAVCIGPSEDGGYYLLGMNDFYPRLFDGMRYSHPEVLAETLERAAETGASVTILPAWYDVDTPAALDRLAEDLQDPTVAAPRTRRALAALGEWGEGKGSGGRRGEAK